MIQSDFNHSFTWTGVISARFEEHFLNMNDKNKNSVFYNHKMEHHNGKEFRINVNIINTHLGDPMRRQVSEGVCIAELKPRLNRKEEWSTGRLIKQYTQP